MMSFDLVLSEAKKYNFEPAHNWLEQTNSDFHQINNNIQVEGEKKWGLLHFLADAEAKKIETKEPISIFNIAENALKKGANHHFGELENGKSGDTAFNVAAPSSSLIGRILTLHWLTQAIEGKSEKKLNDISGSHRSTLAQYIAKWFTHNDLHYIDKACEAGMKIAEQNASGWTPLMASGALGNSATFKYFLKKYSDQEKKLLSTELYSSPYKVDYAENLDAGKIVKARLEQDKHLAPEILRGLKLCLNEWNKNMQQFVIPI